METPSILNRARHRYRVDMTENKDNLNSKSLNQKPKPQPNPQPSPLNPHTFLYTLTSQPSHLPLYPHHPQQRHLS